jgi:hypothetical protein
MGRGINVVVGALVVGVIIIIIIILSTISQTVSSMEKDVDSRISP